MFLSPKNGWEDIGFDNYSDSRLFHRGFIPLILLAALSVFCRYFYHSDASLVVLLQQSIICFLKYFSTYYIAHFFFSYYLPGCISIPTSYSRISTFLIYSVSLSVFVTLVENCIPVQLDIFFLVPLYLLYIMWRAITYLSISFNGVTKFIVLSVVTIITPPIVVQELFNLIVPEL